MKDKLGKYITAVIYEKGWRSLIDLGCYHGFIDQHIKVHFPYIDIMGVDISKSNINFCKRRWKDIRWLVGDGRDLKLEEKFDVVFTHGYFIHIPEEEIDSAIKKAMTYGKEGLFVESMGNQEYEYRPMKYNARRYWEHRAKNPEWGKDLKMPYYYKHNYEKIFKKLGLGYQVVAEFEKKSKTRMYYVWDIKNG